MRRRGRRRGALTADGRAALQRLDTPKGPAEGDGSGKGREGGSL